MGKTWKGQFASCHIAMVDRASRMSGLEALVAGISSEWNHAAPGKIHARKAGEMVETIAESSEHPTAQKAVQCLLGSKYKKSSW